MQLFKDGKAAESDDIQTEISVDILYDYLNNMWKEEKLPKDER